MYEGSLNLLTCIYRTKTVAAPYDSKIVIVCVKHCESGFRSDGSCRVLYVEFAFSSFTH